MVVSGGLKIALSLIVVAVALIAGIVGYTAWAMGGGGGEGEVVTLEISSGVNAAAVGDVLEEYGVVRSSLAFRLRARARGLDRQLQAGDYEFQTGMSVDEAIDVLLEGTILAEGIRFTVPEGLTVEETLERLADQTTHSHEDYREALDGDELTFPDWAPDPADLDHEDIREPREGLLYPETYEVADDASAAQILQRMIDQLTAVFDDVPAEHHEAAAERGLDRYEVLIIASLIERESLLDEEREAISGVIKNRLDADRALEMDAALLYAVDQRGVRVTLDIRNVDSIYNVYDRPGLPPTPIGAAGSAAIRAAYEPEDHDYFFYVKVDHEGRHAFAETFEEHQRNVQRLRELQREADEEPIPPAETPEP